MDRAAVDLIYGILGIEPVSVGALGGGSVGTVYRVDLADGRRVVAKIGAGDSGLACEGTMLRYLAANSGLPLPEVLHADDRLLLLSWIEADGGLTEGPQIHAAELLADLHGKTATRFGFDIETRIGGLRQPNPWTDRWRDFFAEHRLVFMAGEARKAGQLPAPLADRVEKLAGRVDHWLVEPEKPSLIHGDMWGGNVLCRGDRVAAFLDPAVYYADREIELAFSTLFNTYGDPFFDRYQELRPIEPGFFEERRDLYNLYPLLVHVRLFGGHYVQGVAQVLEAYGC